MNTFIIAEAGVNHNGDMGTAMKLVDAAKEAGADAVKFQSFRTEDIVTRDAEMAVYQAENTGMVESQFEMLKCLELSYKELEHLCHYSREMDITFMTTAFDTKSVDMLDSLDVDILKIPSGEITNMPLITHVASKMKSIILSTGMSNLGEVEKAIGWIEGAWLKRDSAPCLTLLHSVSAYPADFPELNLYAMKTLRRAFSLPVGFSDHSLGTEAAIAAVALGATVIEKHFTLDRNMEGPDHRASLEPHELICMVSGIRNIELSLGNGVKRPVVREEEMKKRVRKSIVAARTIMAGEKIGTEDITVKRPGTGISPEFIDIVHSMIAIRAIKEDSVLQWEDLKNA